LLYFIFKYLCNLSPDTRKKWLRIKLKANIFHLQLPPSMEFTLQYWQICWFLLNNMSKLIMLTLWKIKRVSPKWNNYVHSKYNVSFPGLKMTQWKKTYFQENNIWEFQLRYFPDLTFSHWQEFCRPPCYSLCGLW
jgi:hypothetical protein